MTNKTTKAPVWAKGGLNDKAMANARFCAGRDVSLRPMADAVLVPYDIYCSLAHNVMLHEVRVTTKDEAKAILTALMEALQLWRDGKFELDPASEDVHMNIESFVADRCGLDFGGKMHTGRSRNDQAACDMRLYIREQVLAFHEGDERLIRALVEFALKEADTMMPGFTHRQHGAISTVGHWALGHAQALGRDLERLEQLYARTNRNPLGAAAGYGTSWPVDRERTTELLGFDKILESALDAVSSRGETENEFASVIALLSNHISRLAEDLIFFTTQEADFFKLDSAFVTGSSIMPQKRNPDLCEVLQAKAAIAHGAVVSLFSLNKGILSGYDREMQWSKYIIMDIIDECLPAPGLLADAVATIEVNRESLLKSVETGFLEAVDLADWLSVHRGLSFRQGYKISAQAVEMSREVGKLTIQAVNESLPEGCNELNEDEFNQIVDLRACLLRRDHSGSPSPKNVKALADNILHKTDESTRWRDKTEKTLRKAVEALLKTAKEI